jgi:hypothetical protein
MTIELGFGIITSSPNLFLVWMQKHGIETLGMLDTGHGGRRLAAATTADHSRASLTTAMAARSCQSRPCGSSTQVGRWISADAAMGELDPSQAVGSHQATAGCTSHGEGAHRPWRRGVPTMKKKGHAGHGEEGPCRPWRTRVAPASGKKQCSMGDLRAMVTCVGGAGEEAAQQGRPPRKASVHRGASGAPGKKHRGVSGGRQGTNAAPYEGVWLGIGDEEEQI